MVTFFPVGRMHSMMRCTYTMAHIRVTMKTASLLNRDRSTVLPTARFGGCLQSRRAVTAAVMVIIMTPSV